MKRIYKISAFVLTVLVSGFLFLSFQNYQFPDDQEVNQRFAYLERITNEPLEPGFDLYELRNESYEFMLFTYAYSSYAALNIALQDSSLAIRSSELIKQSISKVLTPTISLPYGIDDPNSLFTSDSLPDYSVLYLGHLNLMLGAYRLISSDTTFNDLNDKISESLFNRYTTSDFPLLESYRSAIWIPDNTVALASLKLHSANTNSPYDEMCTKWVEFAKQHLIDESTHVLYSTANPTNGAPWEEPRGSMLGWSIMFIHQFDENFANQLYENYNQSFSNNFGVLRLFRERYDNHQNSIGDVDSGPIFFGYSIPANEFAFADAVLANDLKTAKKLDRLIHLGAKKISENGELKYNVRFLDMKISPMAEALVLYSMTGTKWVNQ